MYSDRLTTQGSRKRNLSERLGEGGERERGLVQPKQHAPSKRIRQEDDKWKHDLYDDDIHGRSTIRNEQRSTQDLRTKLNKTIKASSSGTGGMVVVKDLRDKLSGVVQPTRTANATATTSYAHSVVKKDEMKRSVSSKQVAVKAIPTPKIVDDGRQKNLVVEIKTSVEKPLKTSVEKPLKSESVTVASFLHSLGLSKYQITFQAEEIDMQVLRLMGENDLKELGIPMGPRKKILLALPSNSRR